jgi:hypothetical protein
MTEFNREQDPWKRIERNINIRVEQAKYELAVMVLKAKGITAYADLHQEAIRLYRLDMEAQGNVVSLDEYMRMIDSKPKTKKRPSDLTTNPYGYSWSLNPVVHVTHRSFNEQWVYVTDSGKKDDETD